MAIRKVLVAILFITVFWGSSTRAAETLNNQKVMELVSVGLSETIIIQKIKASKCLFDVSSKSLVELKKANVPEKIIELILSTNKETLKQMKGAVQVAIQGFKDSSTAQRDRALRELVRLGSNALEELSKQGLTDDDARVRAGSATAIGMIRHSDGLNPLFDVITDRTMEVRFAAAKAMRSVVPKNERDAVYQRLTEILTDIDRPSDGAIMAFGYLGMKQALPALKKIASGDTSPEQRSAAIKAIGLLADTGSVEMIIKRLLDDRSEKVRIAAAISLAQIGDKKAIGALIKAYHRYPQNRRYFVGPMARFHDKKIIETLIEGLGDDDLKVIDQAWDGLKLLTGEDMKKDAAMWSEWWTLDGKKRF
jgi:HEAT repeat protein